MYKVGPTQAKPHVVGEGLIGIMITFHNAQQ